jgi:hypothetical protein
MINLGLRLRSTHLPLDSSLMASSIAGISPAGLAQFSRLSARRLLGGIALIVAGMIFGDIFAVFVLHPRMRHSLAIVPPSRCTSRMSGPFSKIAAPRSILTST